MPDNRDLIAQIHHLTSLQPTLNEAEYHKCAPLRYPAGIVFPLAEMAFDDAMNAVGADRISNPMGSTNPTSQNRSFEGGHWRVWLAHTLQNGSGYENMRNIPWNVLCGERIFHVSIFILSWGFFYARIAFVKTSSIIARIFNGVEEQRIMIDMM